MHKSICLVIVLCITTCVAAQQRDGLFKYFFKPRPVTTYLTGQESGDTTLNIKKAAWDAKPTVQIPAVKLTESIRENAQLDATFLASAGGGFTLQRSILKEGKNYVNFSWSPIVVLLTGDTSKDDPLDLSALTSLGFLNNHLQIGAGWDFGSVVNRSRFFGVISFGVNITNN